MQVRSRLIVLSPYVPAQEVLRRAASDGAIPYDIPGVELGHDRHFIDEAPAQLLVMTAEQAGLQTGRPMPAIWSNILNLANKTGSSRPNAWTIHQRRSDETGVTAAGAG